MAAAHGAPKPDSSSPGERADAPPAGAGADRQDDAPLVEDEVLVAKAKALAAELRSLLKTTRRLADDQDRLVEASRDLRRLRRLPAAGAAEPKRK